MPCRSIFLFVLIAIAAPTTAAGQTISASSEATQFILSTALVAAGGIGAMIAMAGFAIRDIGIVTMHHAPAASLRIASGLALAALVFWAGGFELATSVEEGGFLGDAALWTSRDLDPMAAGVAEGAPWFFAMALAGLGVAIMSGAVAGRVKLSAFLAAALLYLGVILPVVMGWVWGEGYFSDRWRFVDHAGAAVLNVTAGAAALAGVMVIGPRPGRYTNAARVRGPAAMLAMTLLGAIFAWIGFLMIAAARHGQLITAEDAITIMKVLTTLTVGGGAGLLAALVVTHIVYPRADLVTVAAGAIGGMVSLTGDPLYPALWQALLIGGVGGVIVAATPAFMDRLGLDDATHAAPAHLFCGLWSVIIVAWTNPDAWLVGQVIGAAGVTLYAFVIAILGWVALKYTIGVRRSITPPRVLARFAGQPAE
ncbi:MAG: hypothetical protein AAGB02_03690 [Pseudomonadota bacterium]